MSTDKHQALIELLLRSDRPLSGDELAAKLHVSDRTVRSYVKAINRDGEVVASTHHGYTLDRQAHERRAARRHDLDADTPDKRLLVVCRDLAKRNTPVSIYDLAEQLCLSESTVEADLTRVRELIRRYDLQLRREHAMIWLDGTERAKRRLVQQILYRSTKGLIPSTWQRLTTEYAAYDLPALREQVGLAIAASDLDFTEFALNDLLVHLVVTLDRVNDGNVVCETEVPRRPDDQLVESLIEQLASIVDDLYAISLPTAELDVLHGVITLRAIKGATTGSAEAVVDPGVRALVAEIMDDISERYLLGPTDHSMQLNLALHLQNLIARAHSGAALIAPLGEDFKNTHPLIHDVALYFASAIESRLGIEIVAGEVDYLTFHMGMQYLRFLEQRDLVTITLVVPRYYDMAAQLEAQVGGIVRGQAVVEKLITTMDLDPTTITSDLIISTVPIEHGATAAVVVVSPFPAGTDIDRILASVRRERERNARRRVRTMLRTLIDPRAFVHVNSIGSKETALATLCEALVSTGYVEPGFYDDVLDRERRSPTAFGGEFAIPHSMFMDANATGIAVLISEKGIPWGSSIVRLVFLFALSPDGRAVFRDALDELTRVLSESTNVTALLDANHDFDAFMTKLMSLLAHD